MSIDLQKVDEDASQPDPSEGKADKDVSLPNSTSTDLEKADKSVPQPDPRLDPDSKVLYGAKFAIVMTGLMLSIFLIALGMSSFSSPTLTVLNVYFHRSNDHRTCATDYRLAIQCA
jgi:hypothetical protein